MIIPSLCATYTDLKNGVMYSLPDVVSIAVTEERNGAFDLEMQYLYNGENAEYITCESFILAVAQRGTAPEPFRIYEITTPISGIVTILAHHISYDLDGVVLQPFRKTGLASILSEINTQLAGSDFRFVNNGITASHQFSISIPQTASSVLGQGEHSLIADFGAEVSYYWDTANKREVVTLNASRGAASDAMIAYGYNLLKCDYTVNSDAVYSSICPFFASEENGVTTLVTLPEITLPTGATTSRTRVLPVDLTSEFDSVPTVAQLRAKANDYIASVDWNAIASCAVDFVPMENTTEYANNTEEQSLSLCDTVTVSASVIGVTVTAKVVRTTYNQITEKYTEMTVGTIQTTIADTIARLENQSTYKKSVL